MNRKRATSRARELRKNFTDAEMKLWKHLRLRNIGGQKLRRQQSIGKYIVDFVCFEKKLIVEADGGQHGERVAYDSDRTAWLGSRGFKVLRFWNNEVLGDMEIVLDVIARALEECGFITLTLTLKQVQGRLLTHRGRGKCKSHHKVGSAPELRRNCVWAHIVCKEAENEVFGD